MLHNAVLVVGGGLLQCAMIQEAKALGLYVICTDANANAPGGSIADEFYPISTNDVPQHRLLGFRLRNWLQNGYVLRGVVTCGADVAPSVAAAAEAAQVLGIPCEVAEITHNKWCVRDQLSLAGFDIYQPLFTLCFRDEPLEGWYAAATSIGYPLVVKPIAQSASRGITIVDGADDLAAAMQKALTYTGDCILLEQCLSGTEHSAEMILGNDGDVLWFNIVDRFFDYSHGVAIETGHVNPTCLDWDTQITIMEMLIRASHALGVMWGPWKCDVMLTAEGPKILECTARLSGGWDSQWTSPATGRHPMRLLLQLACGLPLEEQPQMQDADGYAAAVAILLHGSGILRALPQSLWVQSAESLDGAQMDRAIMWHVQTGDTLHPPEHNGERAGFVLAHASTACAAWETGKQVAEALGTAMEIEGTT